MHNVDENNVKIWSVTRLPFEPKGWLVDMRQQIRQDLKLLNLKKNTIFSAFYVSSDNSFCDVENVLFYNVGMSNFNNLTKNGLIFERVFKDPQNSQKSKFPHLQHYRIEENFSSYWELKKELAKFSSHSLDNLSSSTKIHHIWHALKKGKIQTFGHIKNQEKLGLEIKLNLNKETRISSILKVLLDGIVCGFQSHLNADDDLLFNKISERLKTNSNHIRKLLINEDNAILGKNRLVHKFGMDGIQWNPKDDALVKIQIFPKYHDSEQVTFTGKLFSVKAKKSVVF